MDAAVELACAAVSDGRDMVGNGDHDVEEQRGRWVSGRGEGRGEGKGRKAKRRRE